MASITTRAAKGTPLTHAEVDANFTNLNTDKLDVAGIALGTAASPTVKFTGDTNTGLYSPGADQLSISTGGTERFRIDNNGQLEAVSLGSAASPTYSFTTDPDTGLYSPGANQAALATGGTGRVFVDASGTVGINTSANPTFGTFARPCIYTKQFSDPSGGFAGIHLEAFGEQSVLGIGYDGTTQAFTFDTSYRATGAFRPIAFRAGNAERLRIDTSGRLLVGLTSANTNGGILQLSSGITFPAAQVASADPNTLDDYEEGTFTPTVIGSTTAGTATYTSQTGIYTKIGRQVNWLIYVNWSGGTGSGNLQISGLPFTSANISSVNSWSVSFGIVDNIAVATNTQLNGYVSNSSSVVVLTNQVVGGGTYSVQAYDAAGHLLISGSYAAT